MVWVHSLYIRWFRGYVIPVKLGQDERGVEGSDRYAQKRGENLKKGSTITTGFTGILYQDIQGYNTTLKVISPHSRLLETI